MHCTQQCSYTVQRMFVCFNITRAAREVRQDVYPGLGDYQTRTSPLVRTRRQFGCWTRQPPLSRPPASWMQNTLLNMSHSLIHLPPAHHSHPPSHIHCFIPGLKLTFSTNLFHHSLLAPTWTAFSGYTGPDLLCSAVFHF